jgi:DNA-binding MarR family transcriptional regulator
VEIEKAIKQSKPFRSIYEKAGVNLMFTNNLVINELQGFFKGFGLTMKQYNILRILKGAGKPVSTLFIKERLLDKNSDVSRVVNRMETKSIVKKTGCETDKRLVDVELSVKGEKLLKLINAEMNVMNSIFKGLTEREVKTLNSLLDKIRENKI